MGTDPIKERQQIEMGTDPIKDYEKGTIDIKKTQGFNKNASEF